MRVKLDPSANILLKDNVVPRFFDCQSDRKRASTTTERSAAKKLRHSRTLAEIEEEHSRSIPSTPAKTVVGKKKSKYTVERNIHLFNHT